MSECSTATAPVRGMKAGKLYRREEPGHGHVRKKQSAFIGNALQPKEQSEEAGMPDIQSLFAPGPHFFSGAAVQAKCASCEEETTVQRRPDENVSHAEADEPAVQTFLQRSPQEDIQTKCAECEKEEQAASPGEKSQHACKECASEADIHRAPQSPATPSPALLSASSPAHKTGEAPALSASPAHQTAVVQPSLKVGAPDDAFEKEADQMGERVMRMPLLSFAAGGGVRPEGNAAIQRMEEEGMEDVQTKPVPGLQRSPNGGMQTSPGFSARLNSAGSGSSLSAPVQQNMESAFQADFSGVKIHTGTEASTLSSEIGAQAFTHQNDIYFNDNKYQPDSSEGRFLLAHELTHTLQQGASQTVQRDAEPEPPKEESWWDKLKSGAETVLQTVLPAPIWSFYLKIKNGGLLNYVKETLFDLFVGLFRGLGFSDAEIMVIIKVFVTLKDQLPKIVDDLGKGDCKSLFAALDLLSTLMSEIAGRVWDNLMEAIEPIRQWLIKIWNTYLAPALEEIKAFAGEVWENLKKLGRWIWDKFYDLVIKPYVDAWHWICKKLGFGQSDEPGFIDWVGKKLGEAWDYIKEQLRPVIEPIGQVVDFVKSLVNLEAVRKFQEDAKKWLDEVAKTATAMGGDDDAVANKQLTLREVLLPALNNAIDKLKSTIRAAGSWVTDQVNNIADKVNGFVTGIQQNSFLSPLSSLVSWIPKTVDSLQDWAVDKVNGIFDWIVTGVDNLRTFIQPVLDMLQKIVGVLGNIVDHISDFILGPLKKVPKCIVDPIVKWFTEVILKKIPIISDFLVLAEKWDQIKTAALTVLKQVFVDGQFLKGLWTFFKNLLDIIGIDPKLITSIIAKAAKNFSDIISKPGEFLSNVWKVIKGGFKRFWDKIGTHLLTGALEWLFGKVKGAVAVAPPKDFTLGSILGYILDLFGINKENVYKRMELNPRIGKKRVERIRQIENILTDALEWITVWIKEGPEGLLRKAKEKLSDIKNIVINGVIAWVTAKVSAEIMKRLATSSDPLGIGATINTIIVVYDSIHAGIDYANDILDIINNAMDELAEIILGNTDHASELLEELLHKAVPVAVGFAVQVILGDVADKIKEIITDARNVVDSAIDSLINGALDVIDSIINMGKAAVGKVLGWFGLTKHFTAKDGEGHDLSFGGSEKRAELMIASEPQPFATWIKGVKIDDPTSKEGKELTKKKHDATQKAAEIHKAEKDSTLDDDAKEQKIKHLLDELTELVGPLFEGKTGTYGKVNYGGLQDSRYAKSMHAEGLAKKGKPAGTPPSTSRKEFNVINQRRSGSGTGSYYVLGHLLNQKLGGPGNTFDNLTPITRSANGTHESLVEHNIKNAVDNGNRVEYTVTPTYGRDVEAAKNAVKKSNIGDKDKVKEIIEEEQYVPTGLNCEANLLNPTNDSKTQIISKTIPNNIDQSPKAYDLVGIKREEVYLDSGDTDLIRSIDSAITQGMADKIVRAMATGIRTYSDLENYKAGREQFTDREKGIIQKFNTSAYEFVKLYKGK